MRSRVRRVAAAAVVALTLGAAPLGPEGIVGGFKSRSCMESVQESLGIWAFHPYAVALVWGMTCALWVGR